MGEQAVEVEDYVALYRQAFKKFGGMALWNVRQFPEPSPEAAFSIGRNLRIHGNLEARRLAERLENLTFRSASRIGPNRDSAYDWRTLGEN